MPSNTATVAALGPTTVPPDLLCDLPQATANAISALIPVILTNTAQQGGDGNSVADQALQLAQTALALAQSVQASIPQRRSSGSPISAVTGDSTVSATWTPAMPDADYAVQVTFYGPATAGSTNWSFCVVESSRTVDGCNIRLANVPANFFYSWVVTDLSV